MTSLSDILTAAKNIVTALNQMGQTFMEVEGQSVASGIASTTIVKSGQGRIARISVVAAGTETGMVYDADRTSDTSSPIFLIPMLEGVTVINMPVDSGIIVSPGIDQVVSISYS